MKQNPTKDTYQSFLQIAWPVMAEGFFMELMSLFDLAMVGSLGFLAQAAVGINSQPKMMTLIIARASAVAITAVVSRRVGEGRWAEAKRILKQSFVSLAVMYTLIIAVILVLLKDILLFSGAKSEYITDAVQYGRFVYLGLLFQIMAMVLTSSMVSLGKTKIIFVATVLGNVLNCTLNFGFIHGVFLPKLGVMGVGIGTMSGNILTCMILLFVHFQKEFPMNLHGFGWIPKRATFQSLFQVLKGSLPEQVFERIGMYLYTLMVASLGAMELAVHHICMNICDVFYSVTISLGTAMASMTGRKLGEGDKAGIFAYRKAGLHIGLILGMVFFAGFWFFGKELVYVFNQEEAVLSLGRKIMWINALACVPQVYSLLHAGVLKGAGDTGYVAKYSLILIAIVRPIISFCLIMVLNLGVFGAWIALLVDQILRAIAATRRFHSKKWLQIRI